jgi:hypothetical protein
VCPSALYSRRVEVLTRVTARSGRRRIHVVPEWSPLACESMRFTLRGDGRLKRLLAEAELEKDALREVAKGKF